MEWLAWLPTAILAALSIGAYFARHWIRDSITKSVQHKFDENIEKLRAELRANENEISALRDKVLSRRAQRHALLDKRRLEAVERIWASVVALEPYKWVSGAMAGINFAVAAKRAPQEPNLRKVFELFLSPVGNEIPEIEAKNEQPFVTPIAWAYLTAYRMIVAGAYAKAKALELGVRDAQDLFDEKNVKNLLKSALPHHAAYIDTHETSEYHYLLNELEEKLLAELKKILEGADADQAGIAQSADIMASVRKIELDLRAKSANL